MEILINGSSVLQHTDEASVRVRTALNTRGTGTLTLVDPTGVYDASVGQTVQVYDGAGVSLFGGTIEEIQKTMLGNGAGTRCVLTVVSHEQRLDKRIVQTKVYESTTAGAVVADLITSYADGENIFLDSPSDVQAGATITRLVYDFDRRVSEALTELATLSNYVWWIDPDGYLFFRPRTGYVAPWSLTGAQIMDGSLRIIRSRSDLRNREWLRVNWSAFPAAYEWFNGDDTATEFTLEDPVSRVENVQFNGFPVPFGVLGVDEEKQWYWQPGSDKITQSDADGVVAMSASDTLEVFYRALGSDVVMADDLAAISARQAVETGTGIYEHFADDQNMVDAAAGLAKAQSLVSALKGVGLAVEFTTKKAGLRPGHLLTAAVTTPSITGAWLVESVDFELDLYAGENQFRYHVRMIDGSRINGGLEFWQKLADGRPGSGGISVSTSSSTGSLAVVPTY